MRRQAVTRTAQKIGNGPREHDGRPGNQFQQRHQGSRMKGRTPGMAFREGLQKTRAAKRKKTAKIAA